jgi:hypothetical protein
LVVSQRQLNQSGSHRPNLRKILYVIAGFELDLGLYIKALIAFATGQSRFRTVSLPRQQR